MKGRTFASSGKATDYHGRVGTCPATGKFTFLSRAFAKSHARKLQRPGWRRPGAEHLPRAEPYRCAACGGFHIGHTWRAIAGGRGVLDAGRLGTQKTA